MNISRTYKLLKVVFRDIIDLTYSHVSIKPMPDFGE